MAWDSRNVSASEWVCSTSTVEGNASVLLSFGLQSAACGDEVALAASASMPLISLPGATLAAAANYTIIVIDRDASSAAAPTRSPLRHMALAGVPGAALARGATAADSLQPMFAYSGPRPPAGSGCHRYYAIVYRQADGVPAEAFNVSNRFTWNFPEWAESSQLTVVGRTYWRTGATAPCDGSGGGGGGSVASSFSTGALAACIVIPLLLLAAFLGWRWRAGSGVRAPASGGGAGAEPAADYRVVVENPQAGWR